MRKEKRFRKKVKEFLELLEDNYGKEVEISYLKRKFKEDYDSLVTFLSSSRTIPLIRGNDKIWNITPNGSVYLDKTILMEIQEGQAEFNRYLVMITSVLVFIGLVNLFGFGSPSNAILVYIILIIMAGVTVGIFFMLVYEILTK